MTILFFSFLFYIPQPTTYQATWVETGHGYGAPEKSVVVVKPCQPVSHYDAAKFNRFCKKAGKYLERQKGNTFCAHSGLLTRDKCEDVVHQNTREKRIILRLIED